MPRKACRSLAGGFKDAGPETLRFSLSSVLEAGPASSFSGMHYDVQIYVESPMIKMVTTLSRASMAAVSHGHTTVSYLVGLTASKIRVSPAVSSPVMSMSITIIALISSLSELEKENRSSSISRWHIPGVLRRVVARLLKMGLQQ